MRCGDLARLCAALLLLAVQVLAVSQGAQISAVQASLRRQPAQAARAHTRRGLARSLVDWRRLARLQPQQQSIPRSIFITVPDKARLSRLAQACSCA